MFIRFITQFRNDDDEIKTGVFQAVGFLIEQNDTFDHDKKQLEIVREWFNVHLEKPTRFTKSRRKSAPNVSLSWFKSSAINHLQRMYDLKAILEKYDLVVEVIKREKPGTIIYEDEVQVSTLPYRLDKNKVK